ncbi:MAG: phosphate acyltransferase PlsX, partial [Acidobacteriota bacterium]
MSDARAGSQPRIAVDAMGGDHAPARPVEGAVLAARELGVPVTLVGREDDLRRLLEAQPARGLDIEVVHADDVIGMDETVVSALRRKKNSSLRVAAKLVRDGTAGGLVSAGNTGAAMAIAKIIMGTLRGVGRPALTTTVPNLRGKTVWLDVGANVEVKSEGFREFAIMGRIYARDILGIHNPRIGLLSIGAEEVKGTDRTRDVFKILKKDVPNFIGNVEGRDLFNGECDVVVCDGFTGNVSLKALESIVETLDVFLRQEMEKSLLTRIGLFL